MIVMAAVYLDLLLLLQEDMQGVKHTWSGHIGLRQSQAAEDIPLATSPAHPHFPPLARMPTPYD